MKNIGTFVGVISIFLGITACEKSPEKNFDMFAIPGLYRGQVEVLAPDSSWYEEYGYISWGIFRLIPEPDTINYSLRRIYSIQKVNKDRYTLTFQITDTILPDTITFEISRFEEQSYDEVDAYIKLMENDLWQLSHVLDFGMGNGIFNQFRYADQEWNRRMDFNFVLKRKDRDDFILLCDGFRDHI